jgi:hypothetical protein
MDQMKEDDRRKECIEQSVARAEVYMKAAKAAIDRCFGEGFAAAHPELVGAFMRTCGGQDIERVLGDIGAGWGEGLGDLVRRMESLAENVRSTGLNSIAEAIEGLLPLGYLKKKEEKHDQITS